MSVYFVLPLVSFCLYVLSSMGVRSLAPVRYINSDCVFHGLFGCVVYKHKDISDGAVFLPFFRYPFAEVAVILRANAARLTAVMESLPRMYVVKL